MVNTDTINILSSIRALETTPNETKEIISKILSSVDVWEKESILNVLNELYSFDSWESAATAFIIATELIVTQPEKYKEYPSIFVDNLLIHTEEYFNHKEARIKSLILNLIKEISSLYGLVIYERVDKLIFSLIETKNTENDSWKSVEYGLRLYNSILISLSKELHQKSLITAEILNEVIIEPLSTENKYLREATFIIIETLCNGLESEDLLSSLYINILVECLRKGLSDEYTQVRYTASYAARAFYVKIGSEKGELFYPILLPRMCFNRYHPAEGISVCSQKTWKIVVGTNGRNLITKYIKEVFEYYLVEIKSLNPAIRETACLCINELYSKIESPMLIDYIPIIVKILIPNCKQINWRVRGNSSIALSSIIKNYSDYMKEYSDEMYEVFSNHLVDSVWSVREDNARAMKQLVHAYPEYKERVIKILDEYLPCILSEEEVSDESKTCDVIEYESSVGTLELVEMDDTTTLVEAMNDTSDVNSNRKDDYGIVNPTPLWCKTDGAIYLITELAEVDPDIVNRYVDILHKIGEIRHLSHCISILETLWVELPIIMKHIGKKMCKRILQPFINPMFDSLTQSVSQACSRCAGACIAFINQFVGPTIFKGRLEPDQVDLLFKHPAILNAVLPGTDDGNLHATVDHTGGKVPYVPNEHPVKVLYGILDMQGEKKIVRSANRDY